MFGSPLDGHPVFLPGAGGQKDALPEQFQGFV